jgi:Mg2+ and Co2+ transporter CorA
MALMNLSRLLTHPHNFIRPVAQETLENESDEPELILESHLQAGYSLMNTLDLVDGQLESASDFYEQHLDATRNKILLANMLLTTGALCLTAATVVGSFFGMNVAVPGEGDPGFFTPIVAVTMSCAVLLALAILGALFATGTIQRNPQYAVNEDDI